jgi:hypothetical protein
LPKPSLHCFVCSTNLHVQCLKTTWHVIYDLSDRDRVFTSALWQELFKLIDTTLNMSSAYHPQIDGQTCLETYLRCMVHSCPHKWDEWVSLAEFWYNTTYHSAHGHTPFEALYGYPPKHFGITSTDACLAPHSEDWL